MPIRSLKRNFARKMLPLCIAVTLVVSIVPPLSYVLIAKEQLGNQAEIYARLLAHDIGRAAGESHLWQYRTNKILLFTEKHRFQQDIASVTIRNCRGEVILDSSTLGIGTGHSSGARAIVWIRDGARRVGSVELIVDPSSHQLVFKLLALASLLLGVILGGLLYVFPVKVVGGQADALDRAQGRLQFQDMLEAERQRIARDLHDGVGQALTALQIELKLAKDGDPKHAVEAGHLAEEALDEIRSAVTALRPLSLAETPLDEALRNLVERFELRTGVHTSIRISGTLSCVEDSVAQVLYRVLQESLTNVARHARATEVGVVLEETGERLSLAVTDNGIGFDPDSVKTGGISGIRERMRFCNGTVEIVSAPEDGTVLRCSIPLKGSASD